MVVVINETGPVIETVLRVEVPLTVNCVAVVVAKVEVPLTLNVALN